MLCTRALGRTSAVRGGAWPRALGLGARSFASSAGPRPPTLFSSAQPQRGLAFKPREGRSTKVKVDVKEKDAPTEWWQSEQASSQSASSAQQQQQQQSYELYQQQRTQQYAGSSQYDAVTKGVADHLRKVYATLCAGI